MITYQNGKDTKVALRILEFEGFGDLNISVEQRAAPRSILCDSESK